MARLPQHIPLDQKVLRLSPKLGIGGDAPPLQALGCPWRSTPPPPRGGVGDSAGPRMPTTPLPPQGGLQPTVGCQKGAPLRSPWAPKALDAPWATKPPKGKFCPLCTTTLPLNPTLTLTPTSTLNLVLTLHLPLPLPLALSLALARAQTLTLIKAEY